MLSPLLANIYLQPLDEELAGRGVAFVRYADDIAIFAGSERAAKRILASVVEWIERQLKIEVNRDKSGTGPSWDTQLLGFRIHREGDVSVAPKALKRLKERVRAIWEKRRSYTQEELKTCWRSYIVPVKGTMKVGGITLATPSGERRCTPSAAGFGDT